MYKARVLLYELKTVGYSYGWSVYFYCLYFFIRCFSDYKFNQDFYYYFLPKKKAKKKIHEKYFFEKCQERFENFIFQSKYIFAKQILTKKNIQKILELIVQEKRSLSEFSDCSSLRLFFCFIKPFSILMKEIFNNFLLE